MLRSVVACGLFSAVVSAYYACVEPKLHCGDDPLGGTRREKWKAAWLPAAYFVQGREINC